MFYLTTLNLQRFLVEESNTVQDNGVWSVSAIFKVDDDIGVAIAGLTGDGCVGEAFYVLDQQTVEAMINEFELAGGAEEDVGSTNGPMIVRQMYAIAASCLGKLEFLCDSIMMYWDVMVQQLLMSLMHESA
ncbi:hypothetical protein LIER_19644 [Lithospermum erythrorhizon]|uniref:Uncharacterized protein n=1 Tax=Lithospermum erythrorhizon TaxID=34254 RepID=A0AAV3QK18_LITER